MKNKETNIGEVLTGMSTTRLLAGSGSGDGLDGALEEVAELQSFNQVTDT